jgi:molybdopterin/thiamine biosynthesis adenylyltransferase
MAGVHHHEELYRGAGTVEKLAGVHLTLCGAGALGSNLADTLARVGFRRLRVIDRDRVQEHNISTQIYAQADVGAWKVDVLRSHLFRAAGVEIEAIPKELSDRTARKLLKDTNLLIDAFDNSRSRTLVQEYCRQAPCAGLHLGLYADYGEVIWDEHYRVPDDVAGDLCDYPLARNVVLLTVAVAAETIVRYVLEGQRQGWSITLRDLAIRPAQHAAQ